MADTGLHVPARQCMQMHDHGHAMAYAGSSTAEQHVVQALGHRSLLCHGRVMGHQFHSLQCVFIFAACASRLMTVYLQ